MRATASDDEKRRIWHHRWHHGGEAVLQHDGCPIPRPYMNQSDLEFAELRAQFSLYLIVRASVAAVGFLGKSNAMAQELRNADVTPLVSSAQSSVSVTVAATRAPPVLWAAGKSGGGGGGVGGPRTPCRSGDARILPT